mmetsp:Transcript_28261/g.32382  ORF Transcript_28261/g.32382 Transcript_28261/m.32382 type:complete len:98 (+) Transcript_28261:981-1274(+)
MILGLFSGAITASLGVGIVLIYQPLMSRLGFPDHVSFYTPIIIELCARGAITIQFMYHNYMLYDYVAWISLFAVIGSLLGIFLCSRILKMKRMMMAS